MRESSFSQSLATKTSLIIQKYIPIDELSFNKNDNRKISYTNEELYVVNSLMTLGEVESVYRQLEQSPHLLANFRRTKSLERNSITRFDHIIYHIESHFFRATGILDRLLIHINVVFKLGLNSKKCKPSTILQNQNGQEGKYAISIKEYSLDLYNNLIQLLGLINTFRVKRNEISHEKRYSSDKLHYIEMFNLLTSNETTKSDFVGYKFLIKRETDKAVTTYKNRMLDFNLSVKKLLDPIFVQIENKWIEEYSK